MQISKQMPDYHLDTEERDRRKLANCLLFNQLCKNDQAAFSSEGQTEEVTEEEKLKIHLVATLKGA